MIQRFGAALNVNIHAHALVLDGVFADDGDGRLVFHAAPPPEDAALEALLGTIARRVERLLVQRAVWGEESKPGESNPWVAKEPALAGLTAASVRGRAALGPRPGAAVRRSGGVADQERLPIVRGPLQTALRGLNLDAAVVVPADDRARLERLCRYALRRPIAQERISNWLSAQLVRRSFGFDVLACPRCGGRFRLVALIEAPPVIERILRHLGLPIDVPAARPSRASPAGAHYERFDDDVA